VEAAASTYECEHRTGGHISEDAYIFEVLDPATGDPCPPGADGVLVVTSLFREASPFIRYRVGDIVSISDDPCPCGRTFRRMSKVKGRADEMLKLRGVSVYPTAMEVVLRSFPELGMEWQLVLNKRDSAQEIVVKVEAASTAQDGERSALAARVQERLRAQTGIRPVVEILDPGRLVPSQGGRDAIEGREDSAAEGRVKTRRVIDLRGDLGDSSETP
jgi:phenylacetate-CoA ligase